jgi:hypothetical protein
MSNVAMLCYNPPVASLLGWSIKNQGKLKGCMLYKECISFHRSAAVASRLYVDEPLEP